MTDTAEVKTDEQIFDEISSAIRAGDNHKVNELTKEAPAPTDEEVEKSTDNDTSTEKVDESNSEEKSPPNEADTKEDEGKDGKDDKVVEEELTPEQKLLAEVSKLQTENHKLKSAAGRVPHIQHRLRELDRRVEELTKALASSSSQPAKKIKPKLDEILKDVREADADFADSMTKAIESAMSSVAEDNITRELEAAKHLRDVEARAYHEQEIGRLLERYPNAPEVFQSKFWSDWQDSQPDGIKALAASGNADEVALALELYAKDMLAQHPELQKQQPTPSQSAGNETNEQAKNIEEERKRRQAKSVSVSNPKAPIQNEQEEDLEALFERYSREIRKARLGG